MSTESLIQISNVTKYFTIHVKNPNSNKRGQMDGFKSMKKMKYPALNNVSFDIAQGDWVGVVGKNGSGKSTLLKLVAGVHAPDQGSVRSEGSILPFFGPDEILHPEGLLEDAVMVKAMQVGLPREEAMKIYRNIIHFSELYDFTSQKIKYLSSGMKTRLLLGLILNINADIYLFDEIPATTDLAFQEKVINRIFKLKSMGKTALLVSHNLEELRKYCDKCVLIHEGELIAFDDTDTILRMYAEY